MLDNDTATNTLTYTNEDTEEVEKGKSPVYTVTVTGEDNFAEGSAIYLTEITGKDEVGRKG